MSIIFDFADIGKRLRKDDFFAPEAKEPQVVELPQGEEKPPQPWPAALMPRCPHCGSPHTGRISGSWVCNICNATF